MRVTDISKSTPRIISIVIGDDHWTGPGLSEYEHYDGALSRSVEDPLIGLNLADFTPSSGDDLPGVGPCVLVSRKDGSETHIRLAGDGMLEVVRRRRSDDLVRFERLRLFHPSAADPIVKPGAPSA